MADEPVESRDAPDVFCMVVLAGVHPGTVVDLPEGVQLVALSDAPDCSLRDHYLAEEAKGGLRPGPKAVLLRRTTASLAGGRFVVPEGFRASEQLLQEMALALAIATRRDVLPISWGYQCRKGVSVDGANGWGGIWQYNGRSIAPREPEHVDADKIRTLVDRYLSLNDAVRTGLRTAIERLRLVPSHPWYHERAMDLGIALEATLFVGDKSEYSGEIAYRFAVRGTLLRGGDTAQRKQTAESLRAFYRIRSRVAHGGSSPHGDEAKEAVIDRCVEICFDLITELIMRGQPPDWDGLVMGW